MQEAIKNRAPRKHIAQERLRDALCVLLLLLLTVILFRRGLFSQLPIVFANRAHCDLTHQFYPWRLFAFNSLKNGVIPLWNPYLFCGYPFLANWQSAIFYPLNLIFLCLAVHTSINFSFALHIFIAGMFTYFFMRYISGSRFGSLIASLTFMFSATLILRVFAGHLSMVCTIPWFPAQLLALEAGLRTKKLRYFILGSLALAVQLLAGHPQNFFYSLIGVLLYFVFRLVCMAKDKMNRKSIIRLCICFAVFIAIGFSLGAVQLLPGLEFIQHSSRGKLLDFKEAAEGSFPPENIITFFVPNAIGDFTKVFCWGRCYLWESAVYIGILPIALVLLAILCVRNRFVYIFSAIALISFTVALGGHTPLLKILHAYVPGFNLIRGNSKILFLTIFSLSSLSGFGAQVISEGLPEKRKYLIRALCIIIVFCLLVFAVYTMGVARGGEQSFVWRSLLNYRKAVDRAAYWRILDNPSFTYQAYRMFRGGFVRLFLFLGLTTLVFALLVMRKPGLIYIKALIIVILMADLWSFDAPFLSTVPVSACWWPQDVTDFFKSDKSMFRFLRDIRVNSVGVNQNMNNGFFSVGGYKPNNVAVLRDLVASTRLTAEQVEATMNDRKSFNIIALMNLKYFILPAASLPRGHQYKLRFDNGRLRIYENKYLLPRAYIVHRAKIMEDHKKIPDYMMGSEFSPREHVVLEKSPGIPFPESGLPREKEEAEILSYTPNEVSIRCDLKEAGLLFLSDTYYPGWRVTVDGKPGRILRANYAFRAVPLEKGNHRVRFLYQPASFRWGAALSLLAVVATAIYLLFILKISRKYKKV